MNFCVGINISNGIGVDINTKHCIDISQNNGGAILLVVVPLMLFVLAIIDVLFYDYFQKTKNELVNRIVAQYI